MAVPFFSLNTALLDMADHSATSSAVGHDRETRERRSSRRPVVALTTERIPAYRISSHPDYCSLTRCYVVHCSSRTARARIRQAPCADRGRGCGSDRSIGRLGRAHVDLDEVARARQRRRAQHLADLLGRHRRLATRGTAGGVRHADLYDEERCVVADPAWTPGVEQVADGVCDGRRPRTGRSC